MVSNNLLIAYDKLETDFTKYGLGVITDVKNFNIRKKDNLENFIEFIVSSETVDVSILENENYIGFNGELYTIRELIPLNLGSANLYTVYAESDFYNLISEYIDLELLTDATATQALTTALAGTNYTVGTVDSFNQYTIQFKQINVIAALRKIEKVFGGFIEVVGTTINFKQTLVTDSQAEFRYEKNLVSIEKQKDSKGVITRLYPYGRDDLDISEVNGGLKYIDSPNINNYPRPKVLSVKFDTDDATDLKARAEAYLATIDSVRVSYKLEVLLLSQLTGFMPEEFDINQNVVIYDPDDGKLKLRVVEIRKYPFEPWKDTISLSTRIETLEDNMAAFDGAVDIINNVTNNDGNLDASFLEGTIDALKTRILASAAYETAQVIENQGILFENTEQTSPDYGALYLGPGIFAIANTKTGDDWDWRTFGTGEGFTADEINTGTLNAALVNIISDLFTTIDGTGIHVSDGTNEIVNIGQYDDTPGSEKYGIEIFEVGGTSKVELGEYEDGQVGIRITSENGTVMLDKYGIDPRFIKNFKNLVWNSSFEVYNPNTDVPFYWTCPIEPTYGNRATSSPDSSFFGSRSLKIPELAEAYISAQIGNEIPRPSRSSYGGGMTRWSLVQKFGKVRIEVFDENDVAQTLYYAAGTFDGQPTWISSDYLDLPQSVDFNRVTFVFDANELGTDRFYIKFSKPAATGTQDAYIDAVQVEPDFNGKFPSAYTDGVRSTPITAIQKEGALNKLLNDIVFKEGTGVFITQNQLDNSFTFSAVNEGEGFQFLEDPVVFREAGNSGADYDLCVSNFIIDGNGNELCVIQNETTKELYVGRMAVNEDYFMTTYPVVTLTATGITPVDAVTPILHRRSDGKLLLGFPESGTIGVSNGKVHVYISNNGLGNDWTLLSTYTNPGTLPTSLSGNLEVALMLEEDDGTLWWAVNIHHYWISGLSRTNLLILKSTDGGTTWVKKYTGGAENQMIGQVNKLPNGELVEVRFTNAAANTLSYSSDGGETWNSASMGNSFGGETVYFTDSLYVDTVTSVFLLNHNTRTKLFQIENPTAQKMIDFETESTEYDSGVNGGSQKGYFYKNGLGKYVIQTIGSSAKIAGATIEGGGVYVQDFTDLTDTPVDYTGHSGKVVAVKSTEDGLEFITLAGGGDMLKSVYDTDNSGVVDNAENAEAIANKTVDLTGVADGYLLYYDSASDSIKTKAESGGVSTFTGLTDTPANYTGEGGKFVAVKSTEDGLEFVTLAGGGDMLKSVYDTDNSGVVDNTEAIDGVPVDLSAVATGEILYYDGTSIKSKTESGGGGGLSITRSGTTYTEGRSQNRTTGGTFTSFTAYINFTHMVAVTKFLWDIKKAGTYTLSYGKDTIATVVVAADDTLDVEFVPAAELIIPAGLQRFKITCDTGSVNWYDSNTTNYYGDFLEFRENCLYNTSFYGYKPAMRVVAYTAKFTE